MIQKKLNPHTFIYNKNIFLQILLRIMRKILNILIKIIFEIMNYKILQSPTEAVGHQCWDLECMIMDKDFNKEKKTILIPYHDQFIGNKYFFDNFQKERLANRHQIRLIKSRIICMLIYFQRYYKNISLKTDHYMTYDNPIAFKLLNKSFIDYKITSNLYKEGKNIINKYNLKLDKKFVLIHARDSSFKPNDHEFYRNTDINSFFKLVDYLSENDFQIVRAGNIGMKKSNFDDKIIDLTQVKIEKKDRQLLDVYLVSHCDYMVGTCSGFSALSRMFGTKILSTNMSPLSHALSINSGISIPKLYKYTKNNKVLTFKEIILPNFAQYRHDKNFQSSSLKLIDNSPDEILAAFKDLEKYSQDKVESNLQKSFRELMNFCNAKLHCYESQSSIAPSFIEKHANLLK